MIEAEQQATLNELRRMFEALRQELAETREHLTATVRSLEQLRAHGQYLWRQRLRKLFGVRLGIMHQYSPRKLKLPRHYYEKLEQPSLSFSVVTPSFNQGPFLEQTIRSVLDQGYVGLQYIIQDGASADETAEILQRYRSLLAHCESRQDRGQSHALNLGFRQATGEIMAYLNSDDLLLPGALRYVARYFADHPNVDVVYGHRIVVDQDGAEIGRWVLPRHRDDVLSWADYIPQETLFWRRGIWERAGATIDETFHFAMDWDLILRFRDAGARFVRLPRFLGAFRYHSGQKTTSQLASQGVKEMSRLRERCHGRKVTFLDISAHLAKYYFHHRVYHLLYRLGVLRY